MTRFSYFILTALAGILITCQPSTNNRQEIAYWLTSGDKSNLLTRQPSLVFENVNTKDSLTTIGIDTAVQYQQMDGFGFALTGGSAMLLHTKLNKEKRQKLLHELFTTKDNGIGISYLRITIGSSDLDELIFTYNDLPKGKTDRSLENFSLAYDTVHLIPVLKEILAINPKISIMGSPWSAPSWMKDNELPKGGKLKPEFYEAYANYFVKYLEAMAKQGINVDAITLQNEPENPNNTPSMLMSADEQALFVKKYLGPIFKAKGITTKIIVFDHNCDHPEYPMAILNDIEAKQYIDGSAFHLYLGEINALNKVHEAHPDRNIYFTEQWTSGKGDFGGDLMWHVKNVVIGSTLNWSRTVIEWNLATDPDFNPHTEDGGCNICLGALTINEQMVNRNVSYYIIAQASKFIPAGSIRIASTEQSLLPNVAFKTPEGKKVLIVLNDTDGERKFRVNTYGNTFTTKLPGKSVGTWVW